MLLRKRHNPVRIIVQYGYVQLPRIVVARRTPHTSQAENSDHAAGSNHFLSMYNIIIYFRVHCGM